MLSDALQSLLILQERDTRRVQMERNLAHIPRERTAIEVRITGHRAGIEAARRAVTELELRRKELESSLRDFTEQIQRYRNQQLQVKKNDEYQALTHEIELVEARIGEAEETEIRLLYDLDAERAKAKAAEAALLENIAAENAQLARLVERERMLQDDIGGVRAEVEKARASAPGDLLPRYDRLVQATGLPAVVPLHGQKCGGCHLKVSSGVETEARKRGEIVACDNCGRLLYFEP